MKLEGREGGGGLKEEGGVMKTRDRKKKEGWGRGHKKGEWKEGS